MRKAIREKLEREGAIGPQALIPRAKDPNRMRTEKELIAMRKKAEYARKYLARKKAEKLGDEDAISGLSTSSPKEAVKYTVEKTGAMTKQDLALVERLMTLSVSGLSAQEIGKVLNMPKDAVLDKLKPFRADIKDLKQFQDKKADLYDILQRRLLFAVSDDKIQEAKLYDIVRSARELEDMGRKVRGLDSVRSINIFSVTVKSAYDTKRCRPEGGPVIEGVQDSVSGTGIPKDVREGELQTVQGDGNDGDPAQLQAPPERTNPVFVLEAGGSDNASGEEA